MAFVTTWTTTGADETITIPCGDIGTYNATIDWGDASADSVITTFDDADLTHTYAVADTYTVSITGTLPWVYFNTGGDKLKIKSIEEWGSVGVLKGQRSYYGCTNLVCNATDIPDMSSVTDMDRMFYGCVSFDGDIGGWDVSSVTSMESTFRSCTSFNQDIGGWDVSSVGDMGQMFRFCSSFNQDISNWDVSSLVHMDYTFSSCTAFDQDLSKWDITLVTNMLNALSGVTLSITNYDRLLIGWEAQSVNDNINFHAGNSVYCYGADAHAALIADHTWTITDGGEDAGPCVDPFLVEAGTTRFQLAATPGGAAIDITDIGSYPLKLRIS